MNRKDKQAWGLYKEGQHTNSLSGPSRRNQGVGRREYVGLRRNDEDDQDVDVHTGKDNQAPDLVTNKLDLLLDKMEWMEYRMDDTNRRFENLGPQAGPDPDPPYGDDELEVPDYGDYRRHDLIDREQRPRPQFAGARDRVPKARTRRRGGFSADGSALSFRNDRRHTQFIHRQFQPTTPILGSCWDPPGNHQDQSF